MVGNVLWLRKCYKCGGETLIVPRAMVKHSVCRKNWSISLVSASQVRTSKMFYIVPSSFWHMRSKMLDNSVGLGNPSHASESPINLVDQFSDPLRLKEHSQHQGYTISSCQRLPLGTWVWGLEDSNRFHTMQRVYLLLFNKNFSIHRSECFSVFVWAIERFSALPEAGSCEFWCHNSEIGRVQRSEQCWSLTDIYSTRHDFSTHLNGTSSLASIHHSNICFMMESVRNWWIWHLTDASVLPWVVIWFITYYTSHERCMRLIICGMSCAAIRVL